MYSLVIIANNLIVAYDISLINKLDVNNFNIEDNLSNHQQRQEYDSDDKKHEGNYLIYIECKLNIFIYS